MLIILYHTFKNNHLLILIVSMNMQNIDKIMILNQEGISIGHILHKKQIFKKTRYEKQICIKFMPDINIRSVKFRD